MYITASGVRAAMVQENFCLAWREAQARKEAALLSAKTPSVSTPLPASSSSPSTRKRERVDVDGDEAEVILDDEEEEEGVVVVEENTGGTVEGTSSRPHVV